MLREVQWSEDRSYKSRSENEPVQFYTECLCNSKSLDLLFGYFSSAAINILSLGFATFLYSGGSVRLVINNILSKEDRDTLIAAIKGGVDDNLIDLNNIKQLKRDLDDYGKHFFECLAWLLVHNKIELKIIRPKHGNGISHYKNGIFYGNNDSVGFSASCNFTAYGLLENLERLEAFLSWENSRSTKYTTSIQKDFEEIFFERDPNVEYLSVDDIEVAIKTEFGDKTITGEQKLQVELFVPPEVPEHSLFLRICLLQQERAKKCHSQMLKQHVSH